MGSRLTDTGSSSFSSVTSFLSLVNVKRLDNLKRSKVDLMSRRKSRPSRSPLYNQMVFQATTSTATSHKPPLNNSHSNRKPCPHDRVDRRLMDHTAISILLKHSRHTHINGRSKHAAHSKVTSRPGTTKTARESCSVQISWMKLVKSEQRVSMQSATHFMKCYRKEMFTMSPVLAEYN